MAKKMNFDAINENMAETAITQVKDIQSLYSKYITIFYRNTGRLAPGFDAKVLVEWVKQNKPEDYKRLGGK